MGTWSSTDTPVAPVLINLSHHLCPLRPSPCPQIPGLLYPTPAGRSLPAADNNAPSSSGSTQLRALCLLLSSSPSTPKGRPHFYSPFPAAETEPQSSYYEQADTGTGHSGILTQSPRSCRLPPSRALLSGQLLRFSILSPSALTAA